MRTVSENAAYDYDANELLQRNRKRKHTRARTSGPITKHYGTILHLREMGRFSKVAKMAIFGKCTNFESEFQEKQIPFLFLFVCFL